MDAINMDDTSSQQRAPLLKYSYSYGGNSTQQGSSGNPSKYSSQRSRDGAYRIQKFNSRHKFKGDQRNHPMTGAVRPRPFSYRGRGRGQMEPFPSQYHPMKHSWAVSIQNSPHLRRLSDYLATSTITDPSTTTGPLDLTADPATLPEIEMQQIESYFQAGPRGGAPSKKGPASVHKVKGANSRIAKPGIGRDIGSAGRQKVAKEAKTHIPKVLRSAGAGGRLGYKVTPEDVPPLKSSMEEFPDSTNAIVVVEGDTYDVALALHYACSVMESVDPMPVCVLNFANADVPGGGWLRGSPAQEEQLCYRSTLSATLLSRLYPMAPKECIYSPQVSIFRENEKRGYTWMWANVHDPLPQVSVISMAAEKGPATTKDKEKYQKAADSNLMKDKMRMILRTAAHNRHQRLVLGALGCGRFGHPTQAVANCWDDVLKEKEFQGFFELIVFAIYDPNNEGNYGIFRNKFIDDVWEDAME